MLRAAALAAGAAAAAAAPPTVSLRNGARLPMIGAGSWQYNGSVAEDSYRKALTAGFTLFDTAYGYHNQVEQGRALAAAPRDSIFIETKVPGCGSEDLSDKSADACGAGTAQMLDDNLKQLNTTYVDLVLVHEPPMGAFITRSCALVCDKIRAQWKAVQDFYAAGKAKAVGVSNYCRSCMECLDWNTTAALPMVNQVEFHVGMGTSKGIFGPKGMKTYADAHGVVMQAYSALGGADMFRKQILTGDLTTGIAKAHNVSAAQVALKWIVRQGIPAVTKADDAAYLAEDLDLWSWDLTDDDMAKLSATKSPLGMPSFACTW